jgi:hypothetical protein
MVPVLISSRNKSFLLLFFKKEELSLSNRAVMASNGGTHQRAATIL